MSRWSLILLLGAVACDTSRVGWEEPQAAPADTTDALSVDQRGSITYPPRAAELVLPSDSAMCPGSDAAVSGATGQFSAWLRLRPDSTVRVMAARFANGQWSKPATVDSLDVGKFGCRRPVPSIALSNDGSVHVAYSIKAPEGYGVFFGHSMDGAASFHDPMIIVYGDRLSATAIATDGPRVAIAYEDPSGSAKRVNVALS